MLGTTNKFRIRQKKYLDKAHPITWPLLAPLYDRWTDLELLTDFPQPLNAP